MFTLWRRCAEHAFQLCRFKVKVTVQGQMTKLHTFVSAPYLLNAWMDFNEIGVRCSPYGDDVQNMHFNYVGSRSRSQFKVKWPSYTLSCLLHISWMPGWIFSSPEHEVLRMSFCHRWLSVVRRSSVRPSVRPCVRRQQFSLNDISSETTGPNLMKLCQNVPWVKLFQSCSNRSGPLHN